MNRQTLGLCAIAFTAIGLVAADTTVAKPRIDPGKARLQPKPALQPQIGVINLSECSKHFVKQPTGGKSYNCHFTFTPVCRNGTVLGPVNMKKTGAHYRVTYSCYEPPY
jgi:hypothetical protein